MMDILMAFLAFSAVMIVLSTMATVMVEAVHKFTRQRKKDFERMLTNYYMGSVKPLVIDATEKEAKKFVATIRRNPAFAGEHEDEDSSTRGRFFDTAFEKLTTPQFVEQLARSNIGDKIAEQVKESEKGLIEQLAAEFERYGEGAHDYFRRRAQVLSLFAAVLLAFALNVDAIRLFQSLSNDNDLAKQVIAQIDPDEWEAKYLQAKKIAGSDDEKLEVTLKKARSDLQEDVAVISKLDLPIGHAFFPYCSNSGLLKEAAAKENQEGVHIDERCNTLDKGSFAVAFEFLKWMINALLAGLLIGLGAPFWFKTYSFLAEFVPGSKRGPTTETRETPSDRNTTHAKPAGKPVTNTQTLSLDDQSTQAKVLVNVDSVDATSVNQSRWTTMFKSASGKRIVVDNDDENGGNKKPTGPEEKKLGQSE